MNLACCVRFPGPGPWRMLAAISLLMGGISGTRALASEEPVLFFSDLLSGPASGNSDDSGGRAPNQDGAIVTVWGRNLGSSPTGLAVNCAGAPASSVYRLENATSPANLWTSHGLQKLAFQISHLARAGAGEITVTTNGRTSNALPFTVRPGRILFVKTSGSDSSGDGSWQKPWRTIPNATASMTPGDITYVTDGVDQTVVSDYDSAVLLGLPGEPGRPKALIVYPGARSRIGNTAIRRGLFPYDSIENIDSPHWVVAGFTVTTGEVALQALSGSRVVGNFVTAPDGDGMDGSIGVWGSDNAVLGNELSHVGGITASKFYHGIYLNGMRKDDAPRAPTERNREVAWNYIHDNLANRGINAYSEQAQSAFITGLEIHDNVIINQRGDGIIVGYYITGDNTVYNNLIVRSGLGPDWPEDISSHSGIRVDAGHEESPGTVVRVLHNTLVSCGYPEGSYTEESGHLYVTPEALSRAQAVIKNNVIASGGDRYMAAASGAIPLTDGGNLWFGAGAAPSWDQRALSADPAFVSPASNDFRLSASSPAIDAALPLSPPVPRDLLGTVRPQGKASDTGAYERPGGGSSSCSLLCTATVPVTGTTGEPLSFEVSAVPSGCGNAVPAAVWTFGDGRTGSGVTASHIYDLPGLFTWSVTLTLEDQSCSRSGSINVKAASLDALLLADERVSVTLSWRNQYSGATGKGTAVKQMNQYGYFWFDSASNPEVFVKVLDFGGESFLVFHSALSDLEYSVTFKVIRSGLSYTFTRNAGSVCGLADGTTVKK